MVARLEDQVREARADAGRLREEADQLKSTQVKLEQQLSAVRGQLSKEMLLRSKGSQSCRMICELQKVSCKWPWIPVPSYAIKVYE